MSSKLAFCLYLALWCGIAVAIAPDEEPLKSSRDDYGDIDVESNSIALASAAVTGEEEVLVDTENAARQGPYPYYWNNQYYGYPPYYYPGYPRPGPPGHHHGYPGRPYPGWPYPGYYYPGYPGYPSYPGYSYPGYPHYGYPYPYPGYPYPHHGYPHRARESTEETTKLCKTVLGLGSICTST